MIARMCASLPNVTLVICLCILTKCTNSYGAYGTDSNVVKYDYYVFEEIGIGHYIGNPARDSSMFRGKTREELEIELRRYEFFLSDTPDKDKFVVDKIYGTLSTRIRLDREELCPSLPSCTIDLVYKLLERDLMTTDTIEVVVHIADVNDNAPVFGSKSFDVSIPEGKSIGSQFRLPTATDADAARNNSRVSYSLLSGNKLAYGQYDPFTLKQETSTDGTITPYLTVKSILDRESVWKYNMILTAIDSAVPRMTGNINVNVIITDTNDNAPMFSYRLYSATIQSNAPIGSSVLYLRALDGDTGMNAEIRYSLSKYKQPDVEKLFDVNNRTGMVYTINTLPAMSFDYMLPAEAKDMGTPPLSSTATVKITVIHDKFPPIFEESYNLTITKYTLQNTIIGRVTAVYPNRTGTIEYRISTDQPTDVKSLFGIDKSTGDIITKDGLPQTRNYYSIIIEAADSAHRLQWASTVVSINVPDADSINTLTEILVSTDKTTPNLIHKPKGRRPKRSGIKVELVAGAVGGSAVVVIILIISIVGVCRRKRRTRRQSLSQSKHKVQENGNKPKNVTRTSSTYTGVEELRVYDSITDAASETRDRDAQSKGHHSNENSSVGTAPVYLELIDGERPKLPSRDAAAQSEWQCSDKTPHRSGKAPVYLELIDGENPTAAYSVAYSKECYNKPMQTLEKTVEGASPLSVSEMHKNAQEQQDYSQNATNRSSTYAGLDADSRTRDTNVYDTVCDHGQVSCDNAVPSREHVTSSTKEPAYLELVDGEDAKVLYSGAYSLGFYTSGGKPMCTKEHPTRLDESQIKLTAAVPAKSTQNSGEFATPSHSDILTQSPVYANVDNSYYDDAISPKVPETE